MPPGVNLQSMGGLFPALQICISSYCSVFTGHPVSISSSAFSKTDSWSVSPPLIHQCPLFYEMALSLFICLGHRLWNQPFVHNPQLCLQNVFRMTTSYCPWLCHLVQATIISTSQSDPLKSEWDQSLSLAFWHSKQNSLSTLAVFSDITSYHSFPHPLPSAVLFSLLSEHSEIAPTSALCTSHSVFYSLAPFTLSEPLLDDYFLTTL